MKAAAWIILPAALAPAALMLGLNVAVATIAFTALGISAIALSDYAKPGLTYRTTAARCSAERHALAA